MIIPRRPVVALIGCGHIGTFHSKAIRGVIRHGLVDAEYLAVADIDADRAGEFARFAEVAVVSADPMALIADERVTAVYVCTPTAAHVDLVLAAAAAGKAIFCEKPLAPTLDGARAMFEAVARADVVNQVGLVLRHAPIFAVLRELLHDPAHGRLMTVMFRDDQFFPITGHYNSTWRKDAAITGGGALIEHSIHDLDILAWLCGPVERLSATTRNYAGHAGVEDVALATLHFEGGATAQLASVWHNVMTRSSTRLVEVFMERAYFAIDDDYVGPIRAETEAGAHVIPAEEVNRRYLTQIGVTDPADEIALNRWSFEDLFFLRAVARGTPTTPDFAVALEAHRMVEAVYRSAAEGSRVIEMDEIPT